MILQKLFPVMPRASSLSPGDSWIRDIMVGPRSASGERVSPQSALGFAAYFACIRAISEDVAKLPLVVFKRRPTRGKDRAPEHPAYSVLHDSASEEMTAMSFRETITSHALGWSGGFAEIVRRGDGRPAALYPLDPNTVTIQRSDTGQIRYRVNSGGEYQVPLRSDQVLHLRGLGFDGITQYAITAIGKETIGAALGTQRFSSSFFGNGATTTGTIEVPGAMKDEQMRHLREAFAERHQGAANAHKPIILENNAKWTTVSTDPQKSQLIESMQFSVEDVARLFRVPPHIVGSLLRATNNNIEYQGIEYVTNTLMPWFVRWEQEIKRKLFLPSEKDLFAEHIVTALLRGDSVARSTFYREQWNIGALSQNDIRELENQNPIGDEGDTYYVPLNMIPSEIAVLGPQQTTTGMPNTPATTPEPTAPDPGEPVGPVQDRAKAIMGVASAHVGLLTVALNDRLHDESTRAQKAAMRKELASWSEKFYADAADHVLLLMHPTIDAFCESAWSILSKTPLSDIQKTTIHLKTKAMCVRHVEQSKREMKDPAVVAAWDKGPRAEQFARNEIQSLSEWLLSLMEPK